MPEIFGSTLKFTGHITAIESIGNEQFVHIDFTASNDLGDHATGTAIVALPA